MAGFLIYGPDPLLVSYGRDRLVKNILASGSDIAFERVPVEKVAQDREFLSSELKAQGFFSNRRVICVDGAGDSAVQAATIALNSRTEEDGWLLMTAGQLRVASKLRKLFETNSNAVSAPIYDASLSKNEVQDALKYAGLTEIHREAMEDLLALGRNLAPQFFDQTVEKLSLYKLEDNTPLSQSDIEECATRDEDGSLNGLLNLVLEQKSASIGPALRQVYGQGQNPVTLLIMAQREFRQIMSATCDPDGTIAGVNKLRPPVFGPRREQMIRYAQLWGTRGAEMAITSLIAADRLVRAAGAVSQHAIVERTLMRLSLLRLR